MTRVVLQKTFPIAVPSDVAWSLLRDVSPLASCMPGARIVKRLDERRYLARVKTRIGPARTNFHGEIDVVAVDVVGKRIELFAKGADRSSPATMHLTARIVATGLNRCELHGHAVFAVEGPLARLGSGLLERVGYEIVRAIGVNFAARVQAEAKGSASPPSPPAELDPFALIKRMIGKRWAAVRHRARMKRG